MGIIYFQTRQNHTVLDQNFMVYETNRLDNLAPYRKDDTVSIEYPVPETFAAEFAQMEEPGIKIYGNPSFKATIENKMIAVLDFKIVQVRHTLSRENRDDLELAEIMHAITVEAVSDEAEAALLWIFENQKPSWTQQMDAQENKPEDLE